MKHFCQALALFTVVAAGQTFQSVSQQQKVYPPQDLPNHGIHVGLGQRVALSADGTVALATALGGSSAGSPLGQVYFYQWDGSRWSSRGTVDGPRTVGSPNPGIALSADGRTAVIAGFSADGISVYSSDQSGNWHFQRNVGLGRVGYWGDNLALSANGNVLFVGDAIFPAVHYRDLSGNWSNAEYLPPARSLSGSVSVALSANGQRAAMSSDNSTYAVYERSGASGPWSLVQESTLPGTRVGTSLAMSGDGSTILAGDPFASSGAGAAYALVRSATGFGAAEPLIPTPLGGGNPYHFGGAVALSFDGRTAVVGAPDSGYVPGPSVATPGAVYRFVRSGLAWQQQALSPSDELPTAVDCCLAFGKSVAVSADGITIAAGSPSSDYTQGSVYFFGQSVGNSSNIFVGMDTFPDVARFSLSPPCAQDANGVAAPLVVETEPNTVCTLSFETPLVVGNDYRLTFNRWENSSTNPTRTIVSPPLGGASAYKGFFATEVGLTTSTGTGGTISAGGFFHLYSTATVTATPSPGYVFSGFTGSVDSTDNPLSITMNTPKTIVANFEQAAGFQLTTSAGPGGTVSAGGAFEPGSTATVTATPDSGYVFVGFTGSVDSTDNPLSIVMDAPKAVMANFQPASAFQLTTSAGPGGTVTPGGYFEAGDEVIITATPFPGYVFVGFTGSVDSPDNPLFIVMDAPMNIVANFRAVVELTTSAGPGGVVSSGGLYELGSMATVFATPATGYTFAGFTGSVDSTDNPLIILMDAPKTIVANFQPAQYQLTTSAGTGGTVSPGGPFTAGSTATVTATPSSGYVFTGFTGSVDSTDNPLNVLMDGPKNVVANFQRELVQLTTSAGPGGTVSAGGLFQPGSTATVTATPSPGYVFAGFTGSVDSTDNPLTIVMDGPKNIVANFRALVRLTTSAGTGGTVSAGGLYEVGSTATVTATPSAGYTFTGFTGSVDSTDNPLSILMDGPKSVMANFQAITGTPLPVVQVTQRANGPGVNERLWTVRVQNNGTGSLINLRITGVTITSVTPSANAGLVSVGNNSFPIAFPNTDITPGSGSAVVLSMIFPLTMPATRIQATIRLQAAGYSGQISLSNLTR